MACSPSAEPAKCGSVAAQTFDLDAGCIGGTSWQSCPPNYTDQQTGIDSCCVRTDQSNVVYEMNRGCDYAPSGVTMRACTVDENAAEANLRANPGTPTCGAEDAGVDAPTD